MTVTLVLDNGGSPVTASKTITVQEPATPMPGCNAPREPTKNR